MRPMRILPLTITMALVFLALKVIAVSEDAGLLISHVQAQQDAPEPAAEEAKEEKPPEEAAKPEEPKQEEGKEEKKKEEDHGASGEEGKGEKEKPNPNVSEKPGDVTSRHFSQSELDLLQSLARRRDELDLWERNVQIKEAALNAAEKRIDEKIQQIESMRKAVAELLAQYNMQEEAKLKSLVKIYENMKPDDAARIFDEVEMPILLLVIDKMSEKKAAPILARMDSKKAKQVTVELAEQRRLSTAKLNADVGAPSTTQ